MTFFSRLVVPSAVVLLMAGCATQTHRAPVEQRTSPSSSDSGGTQAPPRLPPGHENAGKPGYYTVKPGDTLIRISLDTGQNWRDIAAWNKLENPNLIEVGQVLRVVPPGESADTAVVAARPIVSPRIETRGLDAARPGATPPSAPGSTPPPSQAPGASRPAAAAPAPATPAPGEAARPADDQAWMWPAAGPVLGAFEEGRRKGVAIGGKAGDPVVAAADGRVVYAGSGLRGYGNLVIIKHSGDFLTAYAHNQSLLVKEDQVVRRGQKIAEMGSTDADRVQLHFELRKQGKPIDPTRQLPPR
ncbi:peptidoglycan DD-metalloendopeptidase family protein [Aquabacterium fontiphilum]|uniref:peptidoglycan DD-metalloendopeptidase family protein n=1 Tax=Aquabacterium fontiphilum TaxID=450365 RepID=UPI001377B45A|nr:peptidoglycan DD-metalloendopeptidase family protein [Aquabacterium fontiphilum]NBD21397.1 peptidoglycan DD-metalloendopeptidase family protein [Aquabacterium fontiphilum]